MGVGELPSRTQLKGQGVLMHWTRTTTCVSSHILGLMADSFSITRSVVMLCSPFLLNLLKHLLMLGPLGAAVAWVLILPFQARAHAVQSPVYMH